MCKLRWASGSLDCKIIVIICVLNFQTQKSVLLTGYSKSPVASKDPLGLSADGDADTFKRRRAVELKHGRICTPLTFKSLDAGRRFVACFQHSFLHCDFCYTKLSHDMRYVYHHGTMLICGRSVSSLSSSSSSSW